MFDYSTLIAPAATVVAAGLGAYFSGRIGQQNAEAESRRTRRHDLADAAIVSALALRTALQSSDPEWTGRDWERVLGNAYDALDAAKPILPRQMLHVRRSIREACGEALGAVAVFELVDIREQVEPTEFDPRWTEYPRDYVGVVIEALQRWREAKERDAVNVRRTDVRRLASRDRQVLPLLIGPPTRSLDDRLERFLERTRPCGSL